MSDIIGWDLIYKISECDLKKKEDVLTLLIHFLLIKAGYKCIGLGDDKSLRGNESTSEMLPAGWNSSSSYSIRYTLNDSLFILRGVPVDDNIVYNFLQVDNLGVTNVAFNINGTVECIRGQIETLLKNKAQDVINKIRAELLNTGPGKDITTQTPATSSSTNQNHGRLCEISTNTSPPLTPPTPFQIPRPPGYQRDPFWVDPDADPLRVGRSDLDPFGRGGGMIFNPFGGPRGIGPDPGVGIPGGLPRGGIPPGARFDPFGPPSVGQAPRPRQPPPDADDFPSWYM